jgi:hypothetical protein
MRLAADQQGYNTIEIYYFLLLWNLTSLLRLTRLVVASAKHPSDSAVVMAWLFLLLLSV